MANSIRVAPDKLRMQASLLRECSERLSDNGDNIQCLLNSVSSAWSGETLSNCICGIENDMPSLRMMSERLNELANIIERAASVYEETDAQIAAMFRT